MLWLVLGVVIGMSEPLSETGRGRSSPIIGWLVAVAAVGMVIALVREAKAPVPPVRGPGRHARDPRAYSGREAALLIGAILGSLLFGIWLIWHGRIEDSTAAVAFGVFALSLAVGGVVTMRVNYRQS